MDAMGSKRLTTKVSDDQLVLVEELAGKLGMTVSQYLRDVILRQHVEAQGRKWPEAYIGEGSITEWGGKRRGAGRKPVKIKDS